MIRDYFSQIKELIERYGAANFVLQTQANFDIRPGGQGYLNGSITFIDGSVLFFKEYLDTFEGAIDKIMYSYHYQDEGKKLIFRYDNARHRPRENAFTHKHASDQVAEIGSPQLKDVLFEITTDKGWV